MGKNLPVISNAEWRVLKELWRDSPLGAKELVEKLGPRHSWNPRTVKTLIHRLVKKGALSFTDTGKGYQYSPAVNEQECVEAERKALQQKVSRTSSLRLIASFIESAELSHDELKELKKLIERKEAEDAS